MNKISTAIYMLIAIVIILLVVVMAKPAVYNTAGTQTGYVKLLNFKGKTA